LCSAELEAQLVGAHFEGEDTDRPLELDSHVPREIERQRGLAHAGPASDHVETTRQEAGAELVPAWKAGGEPAELRGAILFEDFQQPLQDRASALPARLCSAAEKFVRGGAEVDQKLMDAAAWSVC